MRRARIATTLSAEIALALVFGGARAQGVEPITVISPRADAVAVTIYRDDLALITETRTVNLPAGPLRLVIRGVVETLLPQSAVIDGAERPLAESNFGFDRLTPASLLERSVGERVVLVRTDPATGAVTRTPARVVAAGEGVVLETEDGNEALRCSGLPERLEFARIPDGLLAAPELSVRYASGSAGPRTLKVSYLAHGFSWRADYVAHLNTRGTQMQLAAWITLMNATSARFEQAEIQVVAGKLNLVDAEDRGSASDTGFSDSDSLRDAAAYLEDQADAAARARLAVLGGCYDVHHARVRPPARTGVAQLLLEGIVVTARRAEREELGDYQLYRVPWASDLGARQTKQVAFLDRPRVRVERFYGLRIPDLEAAPDADPVAPELILRITNSSRAGLGEPLPAGRVRVFEPYGEREVFAGEAGIDDTPVGVPRELGIARALNLLVETQTERERFGLGTRVARLRVTVEHRVTNTKARPVTIEIRHANGVGWSSPEVRASSQPAERKYGDLMWRFSVPAGGAAELRYQLLATALP